MAKTIHNLKYKDVISFTSAVHVHDPTTQIIKVKKISRISIFVKYKNRNPSSFLVKKDLWASLPEHKINIPLEFNICSIEDFKYLGTLDEVILTNPELFI